MKKLVFKMSSFLVILGLCFSLFAVPGTVWFAGEAPALPQTSVAPGLYRAAQTVSLSCETPDAEIYYTTDNFMPDTGSARYTSPIQISETTNICAGGGKGRSAERTGDLFLHYKRC